MNGLHNYICDGCNRVVLTSHGIPPHDGLCWWCRWDMIGGAAVVVVLSLAALCLY